MNREIDVRAILPSVHVTDARAEPPGRLGEDPGWLRLPRRTHSRCAPRRARRRRSRDLGRRHRRAPWPRSSASSTEAWAERSRATAVPDRDAGHRPVHRHRRLDRRRRPSSATRGWHELARAPPRARPARAGSVPRQRARHRRRRLLRAPSTAPRGRSRCARAIARASASSASRSGPASTPASASRSTARSAGIAVHIGARVAAQARPGRGARVEHGQGPRRGLGHHLPRAPTRRAEGDPRRVADLRGRRRARRRVAGRSRRAGACTSGATV